MKPDPRIKEDKRPLTCFELDEAEEFIGKRCYLFNRYSLIENLDFLKIEILQNLKEKEYSFTSAKGENFRYYLPCEWVKPKEP